MRVWEAIVDWFERMAARWQPPPPPPEPPEYERPFVPRVTPEENARAEQAVRTLEAYVRAVSGRRQPHDPPK